MNEVWLLIFKNTIKINTQTKICGNFNRSFGYGYYLPCALTLFSFSFFFCRANRYTNAKINSDGVFLLDNGGQYL